MEVDSSEDMRKVIQVRMKRNEMDMAFGTEEVADCTDPTYQTWLLGVGTWINYHFRRREGEEIFRRRM